METHLPGSVPPKHNGRPRKSAPAVTFSHRKRKGSFMDRLKTLTTKVSWSDKDENGDMLLPLQRREKRERGLKQRAASTMIDAMMRTDKAKDQKVRKILFLGAGESGKSTVFKQLKMKSNAKIFRKEYKKWQSIIWRNLTTLSLAIYDIVTDFNYSEDPILLSKLENTTPDTIDEDTAKMFKDVMSMVQNIPLTIKSKYNWPESGDYWLQNVDRICTSTYRPTGKDIVRARRKTVGIEEFIWTHPVHGTKLSLIDVGGQKGQRHKWFSFFEDVSAIIFIISLADYDLNVREETGVNRMDDALDAFEQTIEFFPDIDVVVLFNKEDLYLDKIKTGIPIVNTFPDFEGSRFDPKAGFEYFKNKFMEVSNRPMEVFASTAINPKNITLLWKSIFKLVCAKNLKDVMG